jgi:hypothetical protein
MSDIKTPEVELKEWRENAEYLLARCKHTIRIREGGGPESLLNSFIITFMNMEQKIDERA